MEYEYCAIFIHFVHKASQGFEADMQIGPCVC